MNDQIKDYLENIIDNQNKILNKLNSVNASSSDIREVKIISQNILNNWQGIIV